LNMYPASPQLPPLPVPIPITLPTLPVQTINLVGDHCTTATPISVTMSGIAKLGATSTFKGTFDIPNFKNCSVATAALNQLVPGPGNTFAATARP